MVTTNLDIDLLRQAFCDRLVGSHIAYYDQIGNTMDEASNLVQRGTTEGTVVIAEEQMSGRGRFGRIWISPRSQNLSFSVVLMPTRAQLPYVNMAATMAVSKAVQQITGVTPVIKWPNDVLINKRKVSGILIETVVEAGKIRHAIVGIGLNVNFDPIHFPDIASFATSLSNEMGRRIDRTSVLQLLLDEFDILYGDVKAGLPLTKAWAAQLETLGQKVKVSWQDRILEGLAEDVDEQGNLILLRPDGTTITAVAGEVTLQG